MDLRPRHEIDQLRQVVRDTPHHVPTSATVKLIDSLDALYRERDDLQRILAALRSPFGDVRAAVDDLRATMEG